MPAGLGVNVINTSHPPQQSLPQPDNLDETILLPASLEVTDVKPSISLQQLQPQIEPSSRRRLVKEIKDLVPIRQSMNLSFKFNMNQLPNYLLFNSIR